MSQLTARVVQRSAVRTAGLKIRTSMEHAMRDCSQLWQTVFGPRMATFPADPAHPHESYGASLMVEGDIFDYWAVMPLDPAAQAPDGMDILDLPAGPYAECRVASLEAMGPAYSWLYSEWIPAREEYAADLGRAALELYTADYLVDGSLTLLCPLREK